MIIVQCIIVYIKQSSIRKPAQHNLLADCRFCGGDFGYSKRTVLYVKIYQDIGWNFKLFVLLLCHGRYSFSIVSKDEIPTDEYALELNGSTYILFCLVEYQVN